MTSPMRTPRDTQQYQPSIGAHPTQAVRDVETGSLGETIGGAGALVLGILGIIGLLPGVLDAIATIAAGFAVFVGSLALGSRCARLLGEASGSPREIAGGLGLAAMAGLAGLVLGILGLLGVSRIELLSVAPIIFGAGLVISSAAMTRFEHLLRMQRGTDAVYVASGADGLVGAGAIVLGIIALSGTAPLTLSLIAVLAVGAAVLMSGTSIASQLMAFRH